MENLSGKGFIIDGWRVSPAEGVLTRGSVVEHLEPKVMDVLVYFASHPGEVISRDELEHKVWHGALIGYDAVTATVIKLRKALQDNAKQPRIIATIPKKGYQLIAAVALLDDGIKAGTTPSVLMTSKLGSTSKPTSFLNMGVALAILVGILLLGWLGLSLKTDGSIPSIIVMPVENLGQDSAHDVFVDGITEDIITDLSRMSNLMVFASNTTFKYKGRSVTPEELRQDLNVSFVLKGTIRRHDDQIRINMQLVNAETGFNIWAQRYDRNLAEIFTVQDEVTASIIDALSIKLTSQEKQRLAQRATNNLAAYEYFLDGQRLSKDQTRQANAHARDAYKQAIDADPTYGRAYGALAYTLALDYRHDWTDTPVENLERALSLAEQAVALDGSIPQTYWSLGYVHLRRKEYEKAQQAAMDSIRVAPNYADGYGLLALINNSLGQAKTALDYATRGMQLNPYYTWDYLFNVGFAQYLLGNYVQAIESLERAQERNENAIPIKIILAASYVRADRLDDAAWAIEQIRVLNPTTTVSHTAKATPLTEPRLKMQLLDDLRKAGLPE
ncbi:MAG: winged helix-turn-helix domain-containing protein [Gammaproteobacteria bacterium]